MKKFTHLTFLTLLVKQGFKLIACFFLMSSIINLSTALASETELKLETDAGTVYGTLLIPESSSPVPVVLIIAGSGPTDRDGNQPMMMNNSLKFLAEGLRAHGIASLRYDKRGIAKSSGAMSSESEIRFEHYIDDATAWAELLKSDRRFTDVAIAGHSEGSLIGMVAAQNFRADKFISIAGIGQSLDHILRKQLKNQPAFVLDEALPIIDSLADGKMVDEISPMLNALFRKSVQPYLISIFKYNPLEELEKLEIPVMIIQGTTDLQVDVSEAELLHSAKPDADLVILEGMNHVLKRSAADSQQNLNTYSNPDLPLMTGLAEEISRFIQD